MGYMVKGKHGTGAQNITIGPTPGEISTPENAPLGMVLWYEFSGNTAEFELVYSDSETTGSIVPVGGGEPYGPYDATNPPKFCYAAGADSCRVTVSYGGK